ncbi:MAG: glycoside hydrolase family 2 TIM barrel-domain containing protein [Alistipes communis]
MEHRDQPRTRRAARPPAHGRHRRKSRRRKRRVEQPAGALRPRRPGMWDIDEPNLYRVLTRIVAEDGRVLDEVSNPLGLRWFSFDSRQGIFAQRSVRASSSVSCRHQDYLGLRMGAARRDARTRRASHQRDVAATSLRVSHYPQDPRGDEMCDRLGIVTPVEIPVVNAVTESDGFLENSVRNGPRK